MRTMNEDYPPHLPIFYSALQGCPVVLFDKVGVLEFHHHHDSKGGHEKSQCAAAAHTESIDWTANQSEKNIQVDGTDLGFRHFGQLGHPRFKEFGDRD